MLLQITINPISQTSIFTTLLPSFIGTATALGVFYLAYWKEIRKEKKKEDVERLNKLKYLLNLVKAVNKQLVQQLNHIKIFEDKIRKDPIEFHLLTFLPLKQYTRLIAALNNEQYFHAYNEFLPDNAGFDSVKQFNSLIGNVDFQFEVLTGLQSILKNSQDNNYEIKMDFKKHTDSLLKEVGELIIQIQTAEMKQSNSSALLNELAKIDNSFYAKSDNSSDVKSYYDDLVKPIHATIQYHLNLKSDYSEKLHVIARYCSEAFRDYDMIIKGNNSLLDDMESLKDRLNESNTKLSKIVTDIEPFIDKSLSKPHNNRK